MFSGEMRCWFANPRPEPPTTTWSLTWVRKGIYQNGKWKEQWGLDQMNLLLLLMMVMMLVMIFDLGLTSLGTRELTSVGLATSKLSLHILQHLEPVAQFSEQLVPAASLQLHLFISCSDCLDTWQWQDLVGRWRAWMIPAVRNMEIVGFGWSPIESAANHHC